MSFISGVPPPPALVKAEVTPVPKDGSVRKAVPSHFPLLERVKGKTSEQLKALEESFQKSSSPTETELGMNRPLLPLRSDFVVILIGFLLVNMLIHWHTVRMGWFRFNWLKEQSRFLTSCLGYHLRQIYYY